MLYQMWLFLSSFIAPDYNAMSGETVATRCDACAVQRAAIDWPIQICYIKIAEIGTIQFARCLSRCLPRSICKAPVLPSKRQSHAAFKAAIRGGECELAFWLSIEHHHAVPIGYKAMSHIGSYLQIDRPRWGKALWHVGQKSNMLLQTRRCS